jgi:hypothetical protein
MTFRASALFALSKCGDDDEFIIVLLEFIELHSKEETKAGNSKCILVDGGGK